MTPFPTILRRVLCAAVVPACLALGAGAVQAQDTRTFRDRLNFQAGFGYAEETHSDSPAGDISFQAGAIYDLTPRLDVGLAVGWYDAGEARFTGDDGLRHELSLSVIPVFAQALYDFHYWSADTRFFGAAGAGSYTKRVRGDEDCDCTDFGLNLGAGILSERGLGPLGYALEFRYHYLPQKGGEGNQFLSLIGSLNIP